MLTEISRTVVRIEKGRVVVVVVVMLKVFGKLVQKDRTSEFFWNDGP